MSQADDDMLNLNLNDIGDAVEALTAARAGGGPGERERFIFQIGYARGRLLRVSDRIYQGGEAKQ
jgi:hypothetical protein